MLSFTYIFREAHQYLQPFFEIFMVGKNGPQGVQKVPGNHLPVIKREDHYSYSAFIYVS